MRKNLYLLEFVCLLISILLICSCTAKDAEIQAPVLPVEALALSETPESMETAASTEIQKPMETAIPMETPEPMKTADSTEMPEPVETTAQLEVAEPIGIPTPSKTPEPIETHVPVETPEPIEVPVLMETPKPNEAPSLLETPLETLEPAETPTSSKTPEPIETSPAAALTVKISIHCVDYYILEETEAEWTDGQTVFDVLKQVTRDNKIHMDFTGRGPTAYITGINNVYEFDEGPESGWVYYVNGEYVNKGAGAYKLEEGDVIQWKYTKKLGGL